MATASASLDAMTTIQVVTVMAIIFGKIMAMTNALCLGRRLARVVGMTGQPTRSLDVGGLLPEPPERSGLPPLPPVGEQQPLPPLPPVGEQAGLARRTSPAGMPSPLRPRRPLQPLQNDKETLFPGQTPLPPQYTPPVMNQAYMTSNAALRQMGIQKTKQRSLWYSVPRGTRMLSMEESRIKYVPVLETVQGVVEEIRPYGAFVGLVGVGCEGGGEDSHIRGFCPEAEFGQLHEMGVGDQVAVKIMSIDTERQRIHVSAAKAEARQPPSAVAKGVKTPRKARDPVVADLIRRR
ncbi:unnamed protein product [Prorocentrum cordatum]|uniref:S1 motif domain-containing protein n=1 Tax=Prorocentrum cordatum TaxID=2364126 RepID=A0ABN9THE9_9DINO|nr:unnamed protein product [Polarella glacialis]